MKNPWRKLPAGIWALGIGSLCMDTSSELIHSLLPLFMVSVLGSSMLTVGIVEGIAEATAAITKVFSGAWSDRLGRRKGLMIAGYALAAFTKPLFPLAQSVTWVLAARFTDRIGKGIRGAPRDALVADITPASARGAAYGLRQALDSVGALLGPALAMLLMLWLANDMRAAMWLAVIPAFLAVLVLTLGVQEPDRPVAAAVSDSARTLAGVQRLPLHFWFVVLLGAVFTLARFSEAFLLLRAQAVGMANAQVPLVMIVMNLCYAAVAYPAGAAADRQPPARLLLAGLLLLVLADAVLALATDALAVLAGAALWGLHMAFTQGLLAKLVADHVPAGLRGTGFGIFNLATGVALLLASVLAGALWQAYGPQATFAAGALFAIIATPGLLVYSRKPRR